jgi:hypothetical protein
MRICALAITLVARFVVIFGVAIALGQSPSAAAQHPCALGDWEDFPNEPPCSPYTKVLVRTIDTFSRAAFYPSCELGKLTTLSDGSAVLEESPYALFRIQGARVGVMWASRESRYCVQNSPSYLTTWPPRPPPLPTPCYNFFLVGSFDRTVLLQCDDGGESWILGVNTDATVAFRLHGAGIFSAEPGFYGRDPDSTLWFSSASLRFPKYYIFACDVAANTCAPFTETVKNVFQGPQGFIYATVGGNVVDLRSISGVPRAHYFRVATIPLKAGQMHRATAIAVSQIGADGSAWAATIVGLIHEHPDGQVKEIKLMPLPRSISHWPVPLGFNLAPDGSAWVNTRDKLVRITRDDHVEVIVVPGLGFYPEIHFSSDGTVWLKTSDAITHIAPPSV